MKNLLWKKWIYGKWMIFLVTFILVVSSSQMVYKYVDSLRYLKGSTHGYIDYSFVQYFSIGGSYACISIILILFIIFVMGLEENSYDQWELISTMPYSRRQIIISKWFGTIICFIIPLIINFIALTIMYFINYSKMRIYNNYSEFLIWMILSIFTYIFIITFVVFVDLFFKNKIAAVFFNGLVLLMWAVGKELVSGFFSIYNIYIEFNRVIDEFYILPYYNTVSGYNPIYKMLILILFTILFFRLTIKIHDLKYIGNTGDINLCPKTFSIFKIFISITFTLIIIDTIGKSFLGENNNMLITIFTTICFIVLYLGIGKFVRYAGSEL